MAPTTILGAGIVGVCTAYHLSAHQPPDSVHLVETTDRLFSSASGKAGGFLARGWFGPAVAELAALSFDEHRALADALDGRRRWGYVPSQALSYRRADGDDAEAEGGEDWLRQGASRSTAAKETERTRKSVELPSWFRSDGDVHALDDDGPTAQVDPLQFCQAILDECLARGVQLHQPARAVAVETDADGLLSHVRLDVDGSSSPLRLSCTRLIVTAGAWTPRVLDQLFPEAGAGLPITNLAGTSLRLGGRREENEAPVHRVHALFAAGAVAGLGFCPEIFGRADSSLYVAGLNTNELPLPERATDAEPAAEDVATLLAAGRRVLGWDDDETETKVVRTSLCHRPVTPWGRPIIARLDDARLGGVRTRAGAAGGVFMAAGHGPWGISMGPGTGRVVAELVQGRALGADVRELGLSP